MWGPVGSWSTLLGDWMDDGIWLNTSRCDGEDGTTTAAIGRDERLARRGGGPIRQVFLLLLIISAPYCAILSSSYWFTGHRETEQLLLLYRPPPPHSGAEQMDEGRSQRTEHLNPPPISPRVVGGERENRVDCCAAFVMAPL